MKAMLGAVVLTVMVAWTGAVAAQGAPAGYREAIQEALAEHGAGNFEEARALFKRAHGLSPNARTLRGIGMAEYELRNYGDCIQALEEALRSQVQPLVGKLRTETEALLTKARNFVARVSLDVQPGAATVIVDGVPVTLGEGNTLVLRVGDHVLEFKAEGRLPERREVRVNGGEEQTVHVVLSEPASPPAVTPSPVPVPAARTITESTTVITTRDTPAPQASTTRRDQDGASPVPWILAGVSGAVLIGGVVLVAMAQSDINKVEDAQRDVTWPELESAYDRAPIESGIGIAMIGLGVAGVATGIVLGVLSGGSEDSDSAQVAVGVGNVSLKGSF